MDKPKEMPPGVYGVGGSLKWDSSPIEIAFAVELPFHLLMPSCEFTVNYCGIEIPVAVENSGIEIQRGEQYSSTQRNTVFIGGESAARKARVPALGLPGGGLFRATKTLLYITAYPIADACDAFFKAQGPRYQDGYRYFASLANGHMPIVNSVVNAYRRASVDPYASEVTKWDVPNWFVCLPPGDEGHDQCSDVVCLYSAVVQDWYPTIRDGLEGKERPFIAVNKEEVLGQLAADATPGEIDLLDGWSLFHQGRFADSIRSFVTAIEVIIESEIRRILTQAKCSEHVIQAQIDRTRNNFDSRIAHYCQLTGRRLPGPRPCSIPYINGLRLHDELNITRRLRHRIVHHGHRLDESYRGPMLRAAETTSWLFDWMATNSDFESRRRKNHVYFFGQRISSTPFETDILNGKIRVLPLFGKSDLPDVTGKDEISEQTTETGFVIEDMLRVVHTHSILLNAIGNNHQLRDIEHFTRMALYELGLGEVQDSPYPIGNDCLQDRFVFSYAGKSVAVYCLESPRCLELPDCEPVLDAVLEQLAWGRRFDRILVVYNDQYGNDPHCRVSADWAKLHDFSRKHGISIVNAYELARLVLGVLDYQWCHETILNELLVEGYCRCTPPGSVAIGKTYRFWDQAQVLGVQLESGVNIAEGDKIAVIIKGCIREITLNDYQLDSENRLTVVVEFPRKKILTNAAVFKLDPIASYSSEYRYAEDHQSQDQSAMATRVIHPSEHGSEEQAEPQ